MYVQGLNVKRAIGVVNNRGTFGFSLENFGHLWQSSVIFENDRKHSYNLRTVFRGYLKMVRNLRNNVFNLVKSVVYIVNKIIHGCFGYTKFIFSCSTRDLVAFTRDISSYTLQDKLKLNTPFTHALSFYNACIN